MNIAARPMKLMFVRDITSIIRCIMIAIWWNYILWPFYPLNLYASYLDFENIEKNQLIIDYILIMVRKHKIYLCISINKNKHSVYLSVFKKIKKKKSKIKNQIKTINTHKYIITIMNNTNNIT